MLECNAKYGNRDNIKTVKIHDKIWEKISVKNSNNKAMPASFISVCRATDCENEVRTRKERLNYHCGFCRNCSGKRGNAQLLKKIQKELLLNRSKIKEQVINMTNKENIVKREKTLGDKIIEFDNSDGTVATFNRIFDEVLGGDQTDELTILEPYTHYGREIERKFADGTLLEFRFLFDDEPHVSQNRKNNKVWDIFRKSDNKILYTYRSLAFIARDLQTDLTTIRTWNEKGTPNNVNITIVERAI